MTATETTPETVTPPVDEEPERPDVEVMPPPAAAPAVLETPANTALERAAEAALAMPGLAGRDEFLMLAVQARMLSLSSGAPKAVRNNPHLAFHMAMVGRDLGISPSAAIELIDVIAKNADDPDARLSLSPQLLNGQIRRLGLGSIRPIERTNERCVARAIAADGEVLGETEFTWEDAQIANLVDERCPDPLNHWKGSNDQRCRCRQGWRTYPKRMLWWRAAGYCADDYFPEAGLGLYAPEELGAVVDAEGRMIDPGTVELPEGYEPKPKPLPAGQKPAEPDDLWALQVAIAALPDEQREALKERWQQSDKLRGRKPGSLVAQSVTLANSMIRGFENIAKRTGGWDRELAQQDVQTRAAAGLLALMGCALPPEAASPDPTDPQDAPSGSDAPTPDSEPASPTGAEEAPDAADPAATPEREPRAELVHEVIAEVQALDNDEINAALRARDLGIMGNTATKSRRLAEAIVRERHAAELEAERAEQPPAP